MTPLHRADAGLLRADALMDLLFPLWQLLIGAVVAVAVAVAAFKLIRRGKSRMSTALLVTGAAIVGLTVFGILNTTTGP